VVSNSTQDCSNSAATLKACQPHLAMPPLVSRATPSATTHRLDWARGPPAAAHETAVKPSQAKSGRICAPGVARGATFMSLGASRRRKRVGGGGAPLTLGASPPVMSSHHHQLPAGSSARRGFGHNDLVCGGTVGRRRGGWHGARAAAGGASDRAGLRRWAGPGNESHPGASNRLALQEYFTGLCWLGNGRLRASCPQK
jgi:hypothetical protein